MRRRCYGAYLPRQPASMHPSACIACCCCALTGPCTPLQVCTESALPAPAAGPVSGELPRQGNVCWATVCDMRRWCEHNGRLTPCLLMPASAIIGTTCRHGSGDGGVGRPAAFQLPPAVPLASQGSGGSSGGSSARERSGHGLCSIRLTSSSIPFIYQSRFRTIVWILKLLSMIQHSASKTPCRQRWFGSLFQRAGMEASCKCWANQHPSRITQLFRALGYCSAARWLGADRATVGGNGRCPKRGGALEAAAPHPLHVPAGSLTSPILCDRFAPLRVLISAIAGCRMALVAGGGVCLARQAARQHGLLRRLAAPIVLGSRPGDVRYSATQPAAEAEQPLVR